jgi:putative phosphoribosyl transferase
MTMFMDRHHAERCRSGELAHLRDSADVVIGLPRGGVEVRALLDDVKNSPPTPVAGAAIDTDVDIALVGGVVLRGQLDLPAGATGVVIFAHGSGSSRHSPRDQYVAHQLQLAGLGTLLVDRLAPDEVTEGRKAF